MVNNNGERDGLLGLVDRLMRKTDDATPATEPASDDSDNKTETPDDGARDGLDPVVAETAAPAASLEPAIAVETTRARSADELAAIILRALRAIDGCPPQGFEVTVYGLHPWNAMLRITPAAGPVPDAEAWRARVRDMVLRLRDQYDLA